ncbi:site-specific integrase [Rathayibacter sp. AY2B5]|uniref:site-specific integrase n=1 Tax=Rathayibacter sp. AY2B5 TaxID=2080570 RepID=UPI001CA5F343|nr:site-specific integrase [Rathayibacter sp. AY2B5]
MCSAEESVGHGPSESFLVEEALKLRELGDGGACDRMLFEELSANAVPVLLEAGAEDGRCEALVVVAQGLSEHALGVVLVLDALRAWKSLRGSISLDFARGDAFIFGGDSGEVINPNRATMRWSVRVAAAHRRLGEDAIPVMGLHGLRHTHATLLLGAGIHPKVVQERLGHSDISITMSVYSHGTETMQRDAVDRLAAIMAGA